MTTTHVHGIRAATLDLEAHAGVARDVLVCAFSSADEFEQALISERRAQGRYAPQRDWLAVLCALAAVVVAGAALLMI